MVGTVNGVWRVVMGTLGSERGGASGLPFQAAFGREIRHLFDLARQRVPSSARSLPRLGAASVIVQLNRDRPLQTIIDGRYPGSESSINRLHWANRHREAGELMIKAMGADVMVAIGGRLLPLQRTFRSTQSGPFTAGRTTFSAILSVSGSSVSPRNRNS